MARGWLPAPRNLDAVAEALVASGAAYRLGEGQAPSIQVEGISGERALAKACAAVGSSRRRTDLIWGPMTDALLTLRRSLERGGALLMSDQHRVRLERWVRGGLKRGVSARPMLPWCP